MKKKNVIKLIALLLTFAIVFITIPIVAMAKQTSVDGEKPAYIVGEIESMRTETEKVFKMSDGKMQMAVYNAPIHFENEDGEWEQINNKLKSQDSDTYTTKNTAQDISLSKKYKDGKTVEITTNDTNISWGFVGANKASAEIVEQETEKLEGDEKFTTIPNAVSTTVYEDIYDNIDAEYIITGGQVKENLILNKETNQNEFEIEYRYKKLTPVKKDDKTIELQNSKGKTVYTITAPIMTDDNGAFSDDLKLEIVSDKNNKLTVNLIADKDWLQDKERDYPVTIDPQLNLSDLETTNTFVSTSSAPINDTNNVCNYNSAVKVDIYNIPILAPGTYITNVELGLNFNNLHDEDLPIYFLGDTNASSTNILSTIVNNYAEDYCNPSIYAPNNMAVWNITKSLQQIYTTREATNNTSLSYAIVSTSNDLFMDLGYNAISQECNLYPSLQITYINQSGINEKYSYHEFDMQEAGTLYYNDLTVSPIVKRDDFSVENSVGTVDIGMTYTTDFNQNIGASANYYWKPYYSESVSYYPDNSSYKYVWNTDDGEVIYFNSDDNGNYVDENGDCYTLTTTADSYIITTSDSKVFEFGQDGTNQTSQNEKYLTKIYEEGLSDSALNIEYAADLRISKLVDPDGNEYVYTYDENSSNILLSVECEAQDKLVEYSYTNENLTEVTCGDNTVNYEYHSSSNEDYSLKAIVLPEDYKLTLINETTGFGQEITEYGYDSDSNEWIQGSRLGITRYPAKTVYSQLDSNDNPTYSESYRFDKNGYLASVFNGDGYAINQNADQEGNVFANTEITIPVVNLANDSSFEKSTSGWDLTNASVQTKSETANNAYFGNNWLEINNTSFVTAKANQTVTGLSAGTYTFSAYVKTAENSKIELDENNTIYDGVSIRATVGETTKKATGISGEYGDWTRVYVTFDVAENNSSANIELGLYNAKGNIYVDAVQLEKHKRAYDYNAVENADFSNNTVWDIEDTVSFVENTSKRGSLDNKALKITNGSAEQEIYLSNVSDASISAWVSTVGMTATDENCKISVVGYNNGQAPTILAEKDIDFCLSASADNEISFYKVMMPIDTKTNYDNYKIKIEYNSPYGYMLVDGVEVMSGVMNITETEDDTTTDTETETEETDDYQIEDGYTIVSTINSFDTYTGNADCSYLVNGTVVNTTNEDGETVKDETASTAYLGNSWGVTQNKDKYEFTDSTGATKTTGGIWIGGKLDKTTQSGIRFWYKSTASCVVQLRSATYGKGGTYDYIKTLPAAPKGAWVTLLYKDIETTKRKIADFKYLFVKASTAPVYVDEVQTVLQDTIIYDDVEYNIADITQEENNNYPVIDEYIYDSTINNFNSYTGEFGYLVNGSTTNSTAYSGNSWGVTKNIDKYEYVDEDTNETYLSYGIVVGSFDDSKDGIRFWYKSSKECYVSLREQFYGISETDYKVTLPAAPNGDWYTILFDDVANANKDLSDFYCIFVKTGSSPSVYIDELHYVVLDEEHYSVTESYETSRDGQVMKTESASKSLTLNNKLCTINKEINSLGIDTFTTTEDETGNQISATDGNGNTINYSYDDLNNLIEMSQEVDNSNLEVEYTYNSKGNISTITNGNVTYTYKYTPFGDLKSISVGNTPLLTYTYESNQNRVVTKITYANGQTINYSYNDDGMLTQAVSKDSSNNVTNTLTYVNDETGETIKTIDSENETVTLTYLEQTQIWNLTETEILYLYSSDDESFSEFVNGTKFTTTYSETDDTDTKTSLTTTETTAFGDMTKTVYSDAFGRVTKEETKNGNTVVLTKEYTYNSNGDYVTDQVKSVTTTVGSNSPVVSSYTYDNNGNITSTSGYPAHQYRYDEFNQVIYEYDGSQWLEYTYDYDNGGNIVSATDKSYAYGDDEWVDKLTAFNGKPIVYDESGNPVSYLGATLTWKNGRQLASYVGNGVNATYKYNGEGLRTEKTVNGVTYKYQWSGNKLTHQSCGNEDLHFFYDSYDEIIGFTYSNGTTTQEYIYNKNTQGDVIGIIDSNGTTVANYSYDALGYCTQYYGVHYDIADINPIRYRGYYYDEEIEMYYLQSRYYDYNTGRFLNADEPILIEELCKSDIHGTNIFAYCVNNVINYTDPSGFKWVLNGVEYRYNGTASDFHRLEHGLSPINYENALIKHNNNYLKNKTKFYDQRDSRWNNTRYSSDPNGTGTIGGAGCGPTCMAMILSTLLSKNIKPTVTCKWAVDKGYRGTSGGTQDGFFAAIAKHYKLSATKWTQYDKSKLLNSFDGKTMAVVNVGDGNIAGGGHFIVIAGVKKESNKSYFVAYDPNYNSKKNSYSGGVKTTKTEGKILIPADILKNNFQYYNGDYTDFILIKLKKLSKLG